MTSSQSCPCGSTKKFNQCCDLLIKGDSVAETAEQMMRSRYSSFVVKNMDYIRETTDPQTRLDYDFEANRKWAEDSEFQGLEVIKVSSEGNKATVEFKATFKSLSEDKTHIHHEISKFRKQGGLWYFRDGKVLSEA